jgi:lambda family phage tail tape measure protein
MAEDYKIGVEITEKGLGSVSDRIKALIREIPNLGKHAKTAGTAMSDFARGVAEGVREELKAQAGARALARDLAGLEHAAKGADGALRTKNESLTASIVKGNLLTDAIQQTARAMFDFAGRTIDTLDALDDLRDQTGASISNLISLQDIAQKNGIAFTEVDTTLVKLNKELAKPASKSEITQSLKLIGLSAEDLRRIDPAEALKQIADKLVLYANDADKARFIQDGLNLTAAQAAKLMKALATETLGASEEAIKAQKAAVAFNDELDKLKLSATQAARSLLSDFLPALNDILETLNNKGLLAALDKLDEKVFGYQTNSNIRIATEAANDLKVVVAEVLLLQEQMDKNTAPVGSIQRMKTLREEVTRLQQVGTQASEVLKGLHGRNKVGTEDTTEIDRLAKRHPAPKAPPPPDLAAMRAAAAEAERLRKEYEKQRQAARDIVTELDYQTDYALDLLQLSRDGNAEGIAELNLQKQIHQVLKDKNLTAEERIDIEARMRKNAGIERLRKRDTDELAIMKENSQVFREFVLSDAELAYTITQNRITREFNLFKLTNVQRLQAEKQAVLARAKVFDQELNREQKELMAAAKKEGVDFEKSKGYAAHVKKIDDFTNATGLILDQFDASIADAISAREFSTGWSNAFADFKDKAQDLGTFGAEIFGKMTQGLEDGLVDAIKTGKLDLKSLGASLVEDVFRKGFKLVMVDVMEKTGLAKLGDSLSAGTTVGGTASSTLLAAAPGIGALIGSSTAAYMQAGSSGGNIAGLISGVGGLAGGVGGAGASLSGNIGMTSADDWMMAGMVAPGAKGLAFLNGNITPFAQGGLINRPTLFPMANGGMALGGEAGTGAIMPLRRDSRGRLGVGGGRGQSVVNNFVVQGTPDRRSQQQVAAAVYKGSSLAAKRNG